MSQADPPITIPQAHALAFIFASAYVGSIYVSKNARLSFSSEAPNDSSGPRLRQDSERWRNDPGVIRARLLAVSVATAVCCAVYAGILLFLSPTQDSYKVLHSAYQDLGLSIPARSGASWNWKPLLLPHLITPILFLGPLYGHWNFMTLPLQARWSFRHTFLPMISTWQGVRNFVLAPITEELVFRSCVLAGYKLSGASTGSMILFAPMSFGLAHVHHAWDTYNRLGKTKAAAQQAILGSLFQFVYTTLFGMHCSFLFLRTNSIYPPITAHVFCNIMGFPQVGLHVRSFPKKKPITIAMYVLGMVGFGWFLGPFTR